MLRHHAKSKHTLAVLCVLCITNISIAQNIEPVPVSVANGITDQQARDEFYWFDPLYTTKRSVAHAPQAFTGQPSAVTASYGRYFQGLRSKRDVRVMHFGLVSVSLWAPRR